MIGRVIAASSCLLFACSASVEDADDDGRGGDDDALVDPDPSDDAGGATSSSSSSSGGTSSGGAPDASTADSGGQADAGPPPDCVVYGVPGDCLDTSECAAQPSHTSTAGQCDGPASEQCCTPYGEALCDPSVEVLPNEGHTTEAPGVGGCPAGMIPVDGFCIDRYEASLVRANGTSWSPYFNPGAEPVRAVSVAGAVPQGYIDGERAGDACAEAGKRLCTDDEWLRACEGPDATTYPYGNELEEGRCNDHRAIHPAVQYFDSTDSSIYSHIDNACLNQLPISLDLAGARDGCVTAEGAFDMMGNLHEWTSNPAGTFRGGFYVDTKLNGPGCRYATTAHDTHHWDYSTGFRCCAD